MDYFFAENSHPPIFHAKYTNITLGPLPNADRASKSEGILNSCKGKQLRASERVLLTSGGMTSAGSARRNISPMSLSLSICDFATAHVKSANWTDAMSSDLDNKIPSAAQHKKI